MYKYVFLVLLFFLFTKTVKSQETQFGILAGPSIIDIEIDDPFAAGNSYTVINVGAFLDLPFSERWGLKSQVLYHTRSIQDYLNQSSTVMFHNFKLETTALDIQPLLKYDVKNTYDSGFYILGGPRVSFILSTSQFDGDTQGDFDDFYKSTNFGLNLGFGFTFLKHFGFQGLFDYGLTEIVDIDNTNAKTLGAYFLLEANLTSLLK